jgi:hypothetical protein
MTENNSICGGMNNTAEGTGFLGGFKEHPVIQLTGKFLSSFGDELPPEFVEQKESNT